MSYHNLHKNFLVYLYSLKILKIRVCLDYYLFRVYKEVTALNFCLCLKHSSLRDESYKLRHYIKIYIHRVHSISYFLSTFKWLKYFEWISYFFSLLTVLLMSLITDRNFFKKWMELLFLLHHLNRCVRQGEMWKKIGFHALLMKYEGTKLCSISQEMFLARLTIESFSLVP